MYTNPSFVRANPHHVRGRKPTGSGAAWSLTLKRDPDGRFLFGSTCELSSRELSHYCGDRRVYSTRMRTCVLDHHYRLVLASHRLATHHPGGRIAGGCVTGAAHVVGSAWHTPDVALSDDRSRAADGTVERTERRGRRVFQACIRTCGGIFSGCLV